MGITSAPLDAGTTDRQKETLSWCGMCSGEPFYGRFDVQDAA